MKRAIIIEADELSEMIRNTIREELAGHKPPAPDHSKLLTRKEAADYLGVSLTTLARYADSGRLRRRKISGKVFYSTKDIETAMK